MRALSRPGPGREGRDASPRWLMIGSSSSSPGSPRGWARVWVGKARWALGAAERGSRGRSQGRISRYPRFNNQYADGTAKIWWPGLCPDHYLVHTHRPLREGRQAGVRVHTPTPRGKGGPLGGEGPQAPPPTGTGRSPAGEEGRGLRPPPLPAQAGARVGAEGRGPRPPPLPARAGARVGADMRRLRYPPPACRQQQLRRVSGQAEWRRSCRCSPCRKRR